MNLDGVRGGDTASLASLVAARHRALVEAESDLLVLAAEWADRHAGEPNLPSSPVLAGTERVTALGGDGTPSVWEFAPAEFGALQEMSSYEAGRVIADALDLRHRLPLLWRRVRAREVRTWKARKVAQATRALSVDAAAFVDRAVAEFIVSLPWGRFERRLAAKIIEADPSDAEESARAFAAERFVRTGQSHNGLTTLVARAAAGDVVWFDAMVTRLARVLAYQGDTDPLDVRRSKAIGLLAQPARALLLLAESQTMPCRYDTDAEAVGAAAAEQEAGGGKALLSDQASREHPLEAGEYANTWLVDEMAMEPSMRDTDPPPSAPSAGLVDGLRSLVPGALLPPVTLYLHLHQDVLEAGASPVRFEGVGPVTLGQLRELAGAGCRLTVRPVIDLNHVHPADGYEAPERIREALRLRTPGDVFPFATYTGRRMDFDHTTPYRAVDDGGPPGQTGLANGGFLTRHSHRLRTHGRWQVRQPTPGTYLWRSPHGWHYLVNDTGSHSLGPETFAQTVWEAARGEVDVFPSADEVEVVAYRHAS